MESFDPSIFNVLQGGDQSEIDGLNEYIGKCKESPDFVFVLFDSFNTPQAETDYIKKQIIIQIKNIVNEKWKEYGNEQRARIVETLFSLISNFPDSLLEFIHYIFQSIIVADLSTNVDVVSALVSLIEPDKKASVLFVLAKIAYYWFGILRHRRSVVSKAEDSLSSEIVGKLVCILDGHSFDESDSFLFPLIETIIECFELFIGFSVTGFSNCSLDSYFQHALELVSQETSISKQLKKAVISLFSASISLFLSNNSMLKKLYQTAEFRAYAEHYKEYILPGIVEYVKSLIGTEYNKTVLFIVYQIIYYRIDESFICEDLFEFLIDCTLLEENDIEDLVGNPMLYKSQQMKLLICTDKTLSRPVASNILSLCVQYNEELIPELLEYFTTESPNEQVFEAKLFLLASIAKTCKLEFSQEVVELCESLVQSSEYSPFLRLTALLLYSKIISRIDCNRGLEFSLNAFTEESFVNEMPIFCVFAAKVFIECSSVFTEQTEFNIEAVVEALACLQEHDLRHSRSLIKMNSIISCAHPAEMSQVVLESVSQQFENLVSIIHDDTIEAEIIAQNIYTTLYPMCVDEELLMGFFDLVSSGCLCALQEKVVSFQNQHIYNILSLFSQNISVHSEELYQYALSLCSFILEDEKLKSDLAVFDIESFVKFIYPFIAEKESPFIASNEEFFHEFCLQLYQIAAQNKETSIIPIAFIIFLMDSYIQTFGIVPEFIEIAINELKAQILNEELASLVVDACFKLLSACSIIDANSVVCLFEEDNKIIIEFLCCIERKIIGTFKGMSAVEILALNLVQFDPSIFEFAVKNMQEISLVEADDEDISKEEEEEEDYDSSKSSLPQGVEFQYPLPFDSINIYKLMKDFIEQREDLFSALPEDEKTNLTTLIEDGLSPT